MSTFKPNAIRAISAVLTEKGWTIRAAAKALGCHHSHLARIARGERVSARIEKKISELPSNSKPSRI